MSVLPITSREKPQKYKHGPSIRRWSPRINRLQPGVEYSLVWPNAAITAGWQEIADAGMFAAFPGFSDFRAAEKDGDER